MERVLKEANEEEDDEKQKKGKPILVIYDGTTKMLNSVMVPRKGANDYAIKAMIATVDLEWGYAGEKIIVKNDGEPAAVALAEHFAEARAGQTLLESPPPGESASNGAAEKAVQLAENMGRTVLGALQEKIGVVKNAKLIPWAMRHGAWLYSRFALGEDGMTPYKRAKGKRYNGDVVMFGEKVLWLKPFSRKMPKLTQRFEEGVFLGRLDRTNEVLVGVAGGGLRRTRTMRRVPDGEKWDIKMLEELKAVPWAEEGEAEETEGVPAWLEEDAAGNEENEA